MAPYKPVALTVWWIVASLHIILWLTALLINVLACGNLIALTSMQAMLGIALIIYMPAAMILTGLRSNSRFTHAGGEVAYTVVQWIFSAVAGVVALAGRSPEGYRYVYSNTDVQTVWIYAVPQDKAPLLLIPAILSFLQAALCMGWMIWLAVVANGVPGLSARKAYMIPAHKLISGDFVVGEAVIEPLVTLGKPEEQTEKRISRDYSV